MKLILDVGAFLFTAMSGFLFLRGALLPLTDIKSGMEELDEVKDLAADLHRAGKWNMASAMTLAVGLLFQAGGILLEIVK